MAPPSALNMYPMHGYYKMLTEGLRTRDAHLLEWVSKKHAGRATVDVYSRPEPAGLRKIKMRGQKHLPPLPNVRDFTRDIYSIPNLADAKKWWVKSAYSYRTPLLEGPSIVWNPLTGISRDLTEYWATQNRPLHFDLLDDWTTHHAFRSIGTEVAAGYKALFELATSVSANSEGTVQLARRYGRTDAILIPNGCDPEKFSTNSLATGATTVGYIGKIGHRLDVELIRRTTASLSSVNFVFAGPVLDRSVGRELADIRNVDLIGDVRYDKIPQLLERFDIGWVPHGVRQGQVGGDAIKIYEYRAAGLPVITTPIIGTRERPMDGVEVTDSDDHAVAIRKLMSEGPRVAREPYQVPAELTWQFKANQISQLIAS